MCCEWNLFCKKEISVPHVSSCAKWTYPEVAAAGQAGEADHLVVCLAEPSDLPPAQVVDGRERVRRRDTESDGDASASDRGLRARLARGAIRPRERTGTSRVGALGTRVTRVLLDFAGDFDVRVRPHQRPVFRFAIRVIGRSALVLDVRHGPVDDHLGCSAGRVRERHRVLDLVLMVVNASEDED